MKMLSVKKWLLMLLLLPALLQAKEYKEGVEYTRLASPLPTQTGDKIEVQEFFWYGCPHCFKFDPLIHTWLKTKPANVEFVRTPAPLNPNWMVHTKVFYALEAMGHGDKFHMDLFNAMHVARMKLYTPEAIADFLAGKGVDKKVLMETMNSFAVEMRSRKAQQLGTQYKITGVPALSVNGKYLINTSQAGGFDEALKIVDYLVEKETRGQ